ncbi:MAG: MarR family transcriptional regulator [Oscillospiraceae bacterium]|nr:MarR family transcriptional regulator [Oscillospiraceae bacterium]
MPATYGHSIRVLHWCTDQTISNALAEMDLTAAQGRIIGFLAHRKEPPCSRDIEAQFQLSHPTVSGLLSRLEKKGFLEFRPDNLDGRCKRIFLLEKGLKCHELIHKTIHANEQTIVSDFTEEEKALFSHFLDRAIQNMGGNPCCPNKEESHD